MATYMSQMTPEALRREIACRINGGHEMGHGLTDEEFWAGLPETADLTGEEWDVIREKLLGMKK